MFGRNTFTHNRVYIGLDMTHIDVENDICCKLMFDLIKYFYPRTLHTITAKRNLYKIYKK